MATFGFRPTNRTVKIKKAKARALGLRIAQYLEDVWHIWDKRAGTASIEWGLAPAD